MSATTKIEWCDHTWSPWEGCAKVSPGCANCYAESINHRFGKDNWGKGKPRRLTVDWKKPLAWNRKPFRCEACGSMLPKAQGHMVPGSTIGRYCGVIDGDGDLDVGIRTVRQTVFPSICDWLDEEVPIKWLSRFLELIHATPNLDWLLLSKRPGAFYRHIQTLIRLDGESLRVGREVAGRWMDGKPPSNVWIGASVEDQNRADERIEELLKIPAKLRWLSVEPLLGPVDLKLNHNGHNLQRGIGHYIHWVVVGGESGPNARPCNVQWIRDIVRQCSDAKVPCFVKQLGSKPVITVTREQLRGPIPNDFRAFSHPKGGDPSEWPEDLRVRQFQEVLS